MKFDREKIFDQQQMIDTAMSFFLAAERCVPNLAFGNYPEHSVFAPTIVCYAHSIEVILKLIRELIGFKRIDTHDLKILSQEFPEEIKNNLHAYFNMIKEESPSMEGLPLCCGVDSTISTKPGFDWRYLYEDKHLTAYHDSMRRAFIELYRQVRMILPDLKSTYELNWGGFNPDWDWAWYEEEIKEINEMRESS